MRDWLYANEIAYAEDIARIDLEVLANAPRIGKGSLGRFVRLVAKYDYPDAEALNRVMLNHRISTRPSFKG